MLPSRREGPPPAWPLCTNVQATERLVGGKVQPDIPLGRDAARDDAREAEVWAEIWAMPQAVAWERLGWTHDVALYVRFLVRAELGDQKAASEARQWSDRLGLNPAAMLRNRWRVAGDEVGERRASRSASTAAPPRRSVRDRLKVVASGGD